MELSNLLPRPQEWQVVLPTGELTDIFLTLVGTDSPQFMKVTLEWTSFLQENSEKAQHLQTRTAMSTELVASLITGWRGLTVDGVTLPYSHEEAVKLIGNPELGFIREQVEGFATKRANFFRSRTGAIDPVSPTAREAEHTE